MIYTTLNISPLEFRRRLLNQLPKISFDVANYTTITALKDGLTVTFTKDLEYGINGKGWTFLPASTASPAINTGETISFRANLSPTSSAGIGTFTVNVNYNLSGNCNSLLFGDDAINKKSLSGKNYAFYKLFLNNTKLKKVSSTFLPATTLADYCYASMFYGCTSLTTAPELPGSAVNGSYNCMFYGCTSLTTPPSSLKGSDYDYTYYQMFLGCTALTKTPSFNGEYSDHSAYQMFYNCTKLNDASNITITSTYSYSCYRMFYKCTALTSPPKISATFIGNNACEEMFAYCTSLTTTPTLYITNGWHPTFNLSSPGCERMFFKCSSLTKAILTSTHSMGYMYYEMFKDCVKLSDISELKLTDTLLSGTSSSASRFQYCYGGMFSGCTSLKTAPALPATTLARYCYRDMFSGCTSLTTAPELPATTLAINCYENMFKGCTSLKTAPALPATTLAGSCYMCMFQNCTSLTTAPELPATTLTSSCYGSMFQNCTSLETAPLLPAVTLTGNCYSSMFQSCTSLTTAPALPATTLTVGCYANMFRSCKLLTTAPELPATNLVSSCYLRMFEGCTSLNYIKMMATSLESDSLLNWVDGVASTGTFKKDSTISLPTGVDGIPEGWAIQEV